MSTNFVDVMIHIVEDLSPEGRLTIAESIRALDGIVSVHNSNRTPHLTVVGYDLGEMDARMILKHVTEQGVHAELVGL